MKKYSPAVLALLSVVVFGTIRSGIVEAQTSAPPELPRVYLSTAYPATSGRALNVASGGDLQNALNNAQAGDEIILQAGGTYTGNFILPAKSGNDWIIVRSSNLAGISLEGVRVSPNQVSAMAKVMSPNASPAIATAASAHHFRFVGLEIGLTSAVITNYGIVALGDSGAQTSSASVPHDLVIDRCYIHGNPLGDVARGVALNSASSAVIDSYISEIHGVGFDTQAIAGWNGPGPFKIVNNYLEAAGENTMFGGADPRIADLVPSDIEFRRNHCFKPLKWNRYDPGYAGIHWSVKNIFELKNARRVLADGNLFENNWVDGQAGVAVLFTPRNQEGTASWSTVEDVTFTNNIVRHSAAAIHILGRDYNFPSQQARRIQIKNNLFYDIGGPEWGGSGRLYQIIDGPADIQINHNTALHTSNIITADGAPTTGFIFTDNIALNNDYGVIGSGHGTGTDSINYYFPGCSFLKNVIVGGPISVYPAFNFFPPTVNDVGFVDIAAANYRLSAASAYKNAGTDGKDIGADLDAIEASIEGEVPPSPPPPSSNQPPQVTITESATSGAVPLVDTFTATAFDPDGSVVIYSWDFGDGETSSLSAVSHTYQRSGTFTARVVVADNLGATAAASVVITVTDPPVPSGLEVVLYPAEATVRNGNWTIGSDASAAGGRCLRNADAGAQKLAAPAIAPFDFFELTFYAEAGRGYRLWLRGKAQGDSPYNDSVFVQFSGSVDAAGAPVFRISSSDATTINLEDCLSCGLQGWGWQDNGWGAGVLGPLVYFSTTGVQTLRVQAREDGLSIDQIVLSPQSYLANSPGALKNDSTILPKSNSVTALIVSTISPSSGPSTGQSPVVISGAGFSYFASVTFGGIPATGIQVQNESSMSALTPTHLPGAVDVTVTNPDAQSRTLTTGYTYLAPNLPPQVSITTSTTSGTAPLAVTFSANATDPDGSIVSYLWDFGDGQTSQLPSLSHTYQSAGTFNAFVTVSDNQGATAAASVVVTVSSAANAIVRLLSPNGGESLIVGSLYSITWTLTGTGVTRHDLQLSLDGGSTWTSIATGLPGSAASYSWQVPRSPTRTARIRIRSTTSSGVVVEDASDNNFSILNRSKK